ncbi:Ig-like domain repeat protein, partial [Salmonella enterica subsp. diarizonae serovar 48:k:z53]|nr:Ig-like domain repeat protein [Salmonella enterica subsp. diarizonae serovar 48:k:z53]
NSGDITDNITNASKPTFMGHTEAGATVTLMINSKTYITTAKTDGTWSITLPDADTLQDKTYDYTVTATDGAGNISPPLTGSVTIDTTSPSSPTGGLAPASNSGDTTDNITNESKPTFMGHTEAGATVTLMINSKTYITTAKTDGTWSITLPDADTLQDKTYDYTVTATDGAGNISPPLTGSVTIDTTPPSSPTGGLAPASNSGDTTDNITNASKPTFMGTAEAHAEIKMSINHHEYSTKADNSGNWSIKVTDALENKMYDYTITATDSAGNIKEIKNSLIIDTQVPQEPVFISGVDNTDSNTYTLYGKMDGDTGIQVKVEINNEVFTANVDTSTGTWSVNVPHDKIIAGENNYIITATDIAGNSSSHTGTFSGSSSDSSVTPPRDSISPISNSVDEHLISETEFTVTTEDEPHHYL